MAYDDITREIADTLTMYTPEGGNVIDESTAEFIEEDSIEVDSDAGTVKFTTDSGQQYRLTIEPVFS
jgi:hypothetical protein